MSKREREGSPELQRSDNSFLQSSGVQDSEGPVTTAGNVDEPLLDNNFAQHICDRVTKLIFNLPFVSYPRDFFETIEDIMLTADNSVDGLKEILSYLSDVSKELATESKKAAQQMLNDSGDRALHAKIIGKVKVFTTEMDTLQREITQHTEQKLQIPLQKEAQHPDEESTQPAAKKQPFSTHILEKIKAAIKKLLPEEVNVPEQLTAELDKALSTALNSKSDFIAAYRKINSITAAKIFDEYETRKLTNKDLSNFTNSMYSILKEMVDHAIDEHLLTTDETEAQKILDELHQQHNTKFTEITKDAAATALLRPGWLAIASAVMVTNPVLAAGIAAPFVIAEVCKLSNEAIDICADNQTTFAGRFMTARKSYSETAQKIDDAEFNKALIQSNARSTK